jgi:O-antigen/teichoic acid export membrane protein
MGASAVVSYALCAQMSQPVYGITAAGLHFLFPHLASQRATAAPAALRKTLLVAFLMNALIVCTLAGLLLVFSDRLLRLLASETIARSCTALLPSVLAGSALLALSVSGSYAMLALGRVRPVTLINLAGTVALVLVIAFFLRTFGVKAIVWARFSFALISLLVYVPLLHELRTGAFRLEGLAPQEPAVEEA